jgi:hypothetical protein
VPDDDYWADARQQCLAVSDLKLRQKLVQAHHEWYELIRERVSLRANQLRAEIDLIKAELAKINATRQIPFLGPSIDGVTVVFLGYWLFDKAELDPLLGAVSGVVVAFFLVRWKELNGRNYRKSLRKHLTERLFQENENLEGLLKRVLDHPLFSADELVAAGIEQAPNTRWRKLVKEWKLWPPPGQM